jgi:hypothetical protein
LLFNWFLGHRALVNLADGAAVAAGEVDTAAWYASGGREVRVAERRARATVAAYLAEAVGDSGVAGVRPRSVVVGRGPGGPEVTVALAAPARVGLLSMAVRTSWFVAGRSPGWWPSEIQVGGRQSSVKVR